MCSHVATLKRYTKAIVDAKPWNKDPLVIKKAWNEDEYQLVDHGGLGAKLCFAIMEDNMVVRPQPPVKRALKIMREALKEAGHNGMLLSLTFLLRTKRTDRIE